MYWDMLNIICFDHLGIERYKIRFQDALLCPDNNAAMVDNTAKWNVHLCQGKIKETFN